MSVNAWTMFYPDEFSIDEVKDFAAFVYLIQFPDSDQYYIGVKQVWKGIKNVSQVRDTSSQSDWITYKSSSSTVKDNIAAGMKHKKQILWGFRTLQEAALLETALIAMMGTDYQCLNKAIMVKTRLKKDNGQQKDILRRIIGDLL